MQDGRIVQRDVKLGIRGEGSIEITAGLEEGAEVVLAEGQALVPGQRVRAAREEP